MATRIAEVENASQKEETKGVRFAVRLDPQHPGGEYHRAGVKFVTGQDIYFDSIPETIRIDPWLMVAKIEGDKPPAYNSAERREKQAGRLK